MKSQCERLLDYLKTGKEITAYNALQELGIFRLASRINDLKNEGHLIVTRPVKVSNRWGESCRVVAYSLIQTERHAA